jgi:glucosylceramidase
MQKIGVDLMFGTMERPTPAMVDTALTDAESKKYIAGIGFQWAGKRSIGDLHSRYPDMKIYQTEQECGNGSNDWGGCVYSWSLLKHYLNNGTSVYDYWNISLEEGGLSRWGWRQNSLVTVDREQRTFKYTYEYYLMKHASHYILPGARFLPVTGEFTGMMAFRNTDGSYVLLIYNANDTEIKPVIRLGDRSMAIPVPPQSFNTIQL